jgi:hypothetical protein
MYVHPASRGGDPRRPPPTVLDVGSAVVLRKPVATWEGKGIDDMHGNRGTWRRLGWWRMGRTRYSLVSAEQHEAVFLLVVSGE